jgi:hypothetical protein
MLGGFRLDCLKHVLLFVARLFLLPVQNKPRATPRGGGVFTTFTAKGTNRVHISGNAPSSPFCYHMCFGTCVSGSLRCRPAFELSKTIGLVCQSEVNSGWLIAIATI